MKSKNRIYQIDLFRFIAAISVVLYHYLYRGWVADNMSNINFVKIGHFFKYGYLGVNFFFMISGFVIILSIKHRSISKFIVSRFSRLYPIYWISVFLTFIVTVRYGSPKYSTDLTQLLYNLSMFQNYLGIKSIDGVYWTLFVEMKFYIFIVGVYLILNKIREVKIEYLMLLWLFITILYIPFNELFIFKVLNYFLILKWSSLFIAGMIFYQIYRNGLSNKYWFLLSISFAISIYQAFLKIEHLEIHYNSAFSPLIIGTIILLFYLIMFLITTNKMKKINSPKLIQLGMLTYPLYLIHQNIGYIIFNNFGNYINKYLLAFITIVIMIIISFFLSKSYDPIVSSFFRKKLEKLTTVCIKGIKTTFYTNRCK